MRAAGHIAHTTVPQGRTRSLAQAPEGPARRALAPPLLTCPSTKGARSTTRLVMAPTTREVTELATVLEVMSTSTCGAGARQRVATSNAHSAGRGAAACCNQQCPQPGGPLPALHPSCLPPRPSKPGIHQDLAQHELASQTTLPASPSAASVASSPPPWLRSRPYSLRLNWCREQLLPALAATPPLSNQAGAPAHTPRSSLAPGSIVWPASAPAARGWCPRSASRSTTP